MLFFLTNYFQGTDQHIIDICDSVKNYVHSECKRYGQIAFLAANLETALAFSEWAGRYEGTYGLPIFPKYYIIYGIGFVLGFLPLIILFNSSPP